MAHIKEGYGFCHGGYQAFQRAVSFPESMAAILALDTAPRDPFDSDTTADRLLDELSGHENWNGGHYHEAKKNNRGRFRTAGS